MHIFAMNIFMITRDSFVYFKNRWNFIYTFCEKIGVSAFSPLKDSRVTQINGIDIVELQIV